MIKAIIIAINLGLVPAGYPAQKVVDKGAKLVKEISSLERKFGLKASRTYYCESDDDMALARYGTPNNGEMVVLYTYTDGEWAGVRLFQ